MANPNYVIACYNQWTNQNFSMQDFRDGKLQGRYIPRQRRALEKECGVENVNLVFGEPTNLEKAEAMFLRITDMEDDRRIDKQIKYECLINISYEITNACGKELDSNNPVDEKYGMLHYHIPITMITYANKRPLDASQLKKEEMYVTADQLRTARIWLNTKEAKDDANLEKRLYFEYIFELVYNSLKKIFEEVKAEIMGE